MITVNEKPLISIIMATNNRADLLLQRSIPSVLRQTYDNWELLIRGDGAGRDTEFVVNSFNDPRIKYKNLPRRSYGTMHEQWCVGGAHAINDALEEAKGEYIAHLDDDDELLPNHLEILLNLLILGKYDIVYGRAYFETNNGWVVFGEPFDLEKLQRQNLMVHCAILYSRAKLGHFRYDTEGVEPADWRLWKRMAAAGARFGFTEEIVAVHYAEHYTRLLRKADATEIHEQSLFGFIRKILQKGLTKNLIRVFTRASKPHVRGSNVPGGTIGMIDKSLTK